MSNIDFFIKSLEYKNICIDRNTKILDFGCGNGDRVKAMRDLGLKAYGCDLKFKTGENVEDLKAQKYMRKIKNEPYKLPFEDNKFDCIISNAVLEHVQNKEETIAELNRILKPGGVQMHYFPSKYGLIETHIFVPFASIIQNYYYLYFWALLGIRKNSQRSMRAKDVAHSNMEYLKNATCYHSASEIMCLFKKVSSQVCFIENIAFLYHHSSALNFMAHYMFKIPFVTDLFRVFRAVVIMSTK